MHKLSDLKVRKLTKPGKHGDGGGLYLRVKESGAKSWIFRFNNREMGLGRYPVITLAEAREIAAEKRKEVHAGEDPIALRKVANVPILALTFDEAVPLYIEAFKAGWRSARTEKIRLARLTTHASPILGSMDVREIATAHVLKVLSPIWATKSETADKVRQYLEAFFDWCAAKGYRDKNQPNPAAWRGNLKSLLPAKSKVHTVTHIPAMPWALVPAFMVELRQQSALSARALELLILTATRTSDVLLASRSEIEDDLWVIPASRMKMNKAHHVPLCPQALHIITNLPVLEANPYLFPGFRRGRPLSNMCMEMLMRRMKITNATPHGFRSSFRDWAAERTSAPREIAELCLAHQVGNEVERAYRRSTLLEKRRELLAMWADFCCGGLTQG